MDMTGERRILAPRQVVWNALNDPDVLRVSIPGCENLEKQSDTAMRATAAVKIGPISARFTGNVMLADMNPPSSYTISGEGQGGVAGFAKGGAKVELTEDNGATLLRYEVHAQVGGKIAQLGARLVDASAKQMADQFFDRFSAAVAPATAAPAAVAVAATPLVTPVPVPAASLVTPTPEAAAPAASRAADVFPAAPASTQDRTGPATTHQVFPAAPSSEVAEPVLPPRAPPSSVSMLDLLPREPFGLPIAAWIGCLVFLFILLLYIGSIL